MLFIRLLGYKPMFLPSGKLTVCYWKWPFISWIYPVNMVIFHSFLLVYQRVCYMMLYVTLLYFLKIYKGFIPSISNQFNNIVYVYFYQFMNHLGSSPAWWVVWKSARSCPSKMDSQNLRAALSTPLPPSILPNSTSHFPTSSLLTKKT